MTRLTKTLGLAKRRRLAAAGESKLARNLLRRRNDGFDDAILLQILLPDLRHGDRYRRDRPAGIIEERSADAVETFFHLFVVFGVPLPANLLELLTQRFGIGNGIFRVARQRARCDDAVDLRAIEVR